MKFYDRPDCLSVRDELLTVAFDVYVNEQPFWRPESIKEACGYKKWKPINRLAFDLPISLSKVALAETEICEPADIKHVTMEVDDEMITVAPNSEADLYEDDFVKDLLTRLQKVFYGHRHSMCLSRGRDILAAEHVREDRKLVTRRTVDGQVLIP